MTADRAEIVKIIMEHEFKGIIAEHNADSILQKILAIGALSCWHMYGFIDKKKVREYALGEEDAQSIYWAFRNTGFFKALDALVYSEHSWGWTFHDLDLLEGLVGLVQSKLEYLPEEDRDPNAWGALNIFRNFITGVDSLNVLLTTIPCVCYHCIKSNLRVFVKNFKEIMRTRKECQKYLKENTDIDDIDALFESGKDEMD